MSAAQEISADLQQLTTPAALVERSVVVENCRRMQARARGLGVRLRPHAKTHKCVEAARLQVAGGFDGLTVSTLAEARHFAAAGFDDLLWALPLDPGRLPEVLELSEGLRNFHLLVDHPAVVAEAQKAAAAREVRLSLWLKVDTGYHRCGIDPEAEESLALAKRLAAHPAISFAGLLSHGGDAYDAADRSAAAAAGRREARALSQFADRLRGAGVEIPDLSVGSTPGLSSLSVEHPSSGPAAPWASISEIRPGNYVFYDCYQSAIGVCRLGDVALSVLATVIGCYPHRRQLVVNAGALALSKDEGPQHVDSNCGYGEVQSPQGAPLDGLRLVSLSQEHGVIRTDSSSQAAAFPPGSRVRILPNHSCLTAALFDRYHVLDEGRVVEEWKPVRGW
ncbi:MAG: alanine racemase [Acidobacteriota bacterium]